MRSTSKAFAGILCALSLSTAPATTVYETGNHLLRDLRDPSGSGFGTAYSLGYIVGAADAYSVTHLCIPGTVTKGQLQDVVFQYLLANAAIRDLPADVLVLMALSQHWSCPKEGKRKGRV